MSAGLVDRWRGERKTYCAPKGASKSKIDCFLIKQTSHHGSGDNLCLGEDVRVNFGDLADGKTPQRLSLIHI